MDDIIGSLIDLQIAGSGGGSSGSILDQLDREPTLAEVEIGEGWSVKIKITNAISYLLQRYNNDGLIGTGVPGEMYPWEDVRGWTWLTCICKGGTKCALLTTSRIEDNSKAESTTFNPDTMRMNTVVYRAEWHSDFSGSNAKLGVKDYEDSRYSAGVGDYSIVFDVSYTISGFNIPDPKNKPNEREEYSRQGTTEGVTLYFGSEVRESAVWADGLDGAQRRDLYCEFINAYYKNHVLPFIKQ